MTQQIADRVYNCYDVLFYSGSGPFAACAEIVSATDFYEQCLHDVCACGALQSSGAQCECTSFATYARECALRGVVLNWRGPEMCQDGEWTH